MKILIFSHDCGLRGAERVVLSEAESLTSRGWRVTVVVPCRDGRLAQALKQKGIPYVSFRYYSWMGPGRIMGRAIRTVFNIVALPWLILLIRIHRPDVVHIHSLACGIGAIAASLSGVARIWHIHETGPYGISADRPVFDLGVRLSTRLIRWTRCRFLAVSAEISRLYGDQLGLTDIRILYQDVSIDKAAALGDRDALALISSWPGRRLVIVGSIIPLKDPKTAVRALPRILQSWPGTGLFLIGDDPVGMGEEIRALARDLRVADNVVQIGTLANAAPAIIAAEACIITSLDEGFGRVAVEAMLSETPVISANVAINREVAGDDNVDFFAPSDPEDLATAVSAVFARPEAERRRRALRALRYAHSKFGAVTAVNALETELLASIGPGKAVSDPEQNIPS